MIKINLELPDFEKELNISVTLRKDGGGVIKASSSSPEVITEVSGSEMITETENIIPVGNKSNLMDMNF